MEISVPDIHMETLQLEDYSKLDWEWSIFNPEEKKHRHETVFPQEYAKAYDMGAALIKIGRRNKNVLLYAHL